MAEVISLEDRRPRSASARTAEEVLDDLLRMIGECPDPTEAALNVIAGFSRFVATRGVTTDQIARLVERHVAQELGEFPSLAVANEPRVIECGLAATAEPAGAEIAAREPDLFD